MQSVDLTRGAIKISGIYFFYNINLMNQKNCSKAITIIPGLLKLWRMRVFILKVKSQFLRHQLSPNWSIWHFFLLFLIITDEMQKSFIWHDSSPKIKHETPRMEFKAGDLKSVDIHFKFVSLQCSWVKKLYDGCFH